MLFGVRASWVVIYSKPRPQKDLKRTAVTVTIVNSQFSIWNTHSDDRAMKEKETRKQSDLDFFLAWACGFAETKFNISSISDSTFKNMHQFQSTKSQVLLQWIHNIWLEEKHIHLNSSTKTLTTIEDPPIVLQLLPAPSTKLWTPFYTFDFGYIGVI